MRILRPIGERLKQRAELALAQFVGAGGSQQRGAQIRIPDGERTVVFVIGVVVETHYGEVGALTEQQELIELQPHLGIGVCVKLTRPQQGHGQLADGAIDGDRHDGPRFVVFHAGSEGDARLNRLDHQHFVANRKLVLQHLALIGKAARGLVHQHRLIQKAARQADAREMNRRPQQFDHREALLESALELAYFDDGAIQLFGHFIDVRHGQVGEPGFKGVPDSGTKRQRRQLLGRYAEFQCRLCCHPLKHP